MRVIRECKYEGYKGVNQLLYLIYALFRQLGAKSGNGGESEAVQETAVFLTIMKMASVEEWRERKKNKKNKGTDDDWWRWNGDDEDGKR